MPALNFQKQFAPAVEDGSKPQSIRANRKCPFKAGDRLFFYTGQRTKYCRKLGESVCTEASDIEIYQGYGFWRVLINYRLLELVEIADLARADGFQSVNDFFAFFDRGADGFKGQIIHWRTPISMRLTRRVLRFFRKALSKK